jgi:hypothetical protein
LPTRTRSTPAIPSPTDTGGSPHPNSLPAIPSAGRSRRRPTGAVGTRSPGQHDDQRDEAVSAFRPTSGLVCLTGSSSTQRPPSCAGWPARAEPGRGERTPVSKHPEGTIPPGGLLMHASVLPQAHGRGMRVPHRRVRLQRKPRRQCDTLAVIFRTTPVHESRIAGRISHVGGGCQRESPGGASTPRPGSPSCYPPNDRGADQGPGKAPRASSSARKRSNTPLPS